MPPLDHSGVDSGERVLRPHVPIGWSQTSWDILGFNLSRSGHCTGLTPGPPFLLRPRHVLTYQMLRVHRAQAPAGLWATPPEGFHSLRETPGILMLTNREVK